MKRITLLLCMSLCISITIYANEDVAYIHKVFSKENLHLSAISICEDKRCCYILAEYQEGNKFYSAERIEIEKIVLDSIRYIKVDIDTEFGSFDANILKDRGMIFVGALYNSRVLSTEKEELLRLVSYIGTIKKSSQPTYLSRQTISLPHLFWRNDKDGTAQSSYYKEREMHRRVEEANILVDEYRGDIIRTCAESLPAWKKKMSEDEFKGFVNTLEDMGKMNALEKAVLERRVIPEEEWAKRVDAWWALPIDKRE